MYMFVCIYIHICGECKYNIYIYVCDISIYVRIQTIYIIYIICVSM